MALANFFVKRGGDVLPTRMVMSIAMAITVLPLALFAPLPPANLWPNIIGAVMVHWIYQFAMIRALHRGDLSFVFPVMRGLAPLATATLAVFVLGEQLSPLAITGLIVACAAILVFASPTGTTHTQRKLDRAAMFWSVATAIGIGAYSVVDAHVARAMPTTLTFVVWLFLLDWIGITVVTCWARRGRLWSAIRPQLKTGILGGVVGTLSYGAAIYAFTLSDAAMVSALRETSVLFAALLGCHFLNESFGKRRVFAAAILAAALVMMQIS